MNGHWLDEAIDATDWRILAALQRDGRATFADLARAVDLSRPAVTERVRRLEDRGIIVGYRAVVDPRALGYAVRAEVRLCAEAACLPRVERLVAEIPAILECDRGPGNDCFVFRVIARSPAELTALVDRIGTLGRVHATLLLSALVTGRSVPPPASPPTPAERVSTPR